MFITIITTVIDIISIITFIIVIIIITGLLQRPDRRVRERRPVAGRPSRFSYLSIYIYIYIWYVFVYLSIYLSIYIYIYIYIEREREIGIPRVSNIVFYWFSLIFIDLRRVCLFNQF